MLKKFLTLSLVGLLVHTLFAGSVLAQTGTDKEALFIEQAKTKIVRLGVGEKARATIKLKNGTKLKGYIAQAGENEFIVRDLKTDTPTNVAYGDVAKIESHKGHSTAKSIAIGAGVGAAAFFALIAILFAVYDD